MGRDGETLIVVILDDNSLQNHANGIKDDHDSSSSDDDNDETIKIDMISMTNKVKPKEGKQVANTGCPIHMECGMFDEYALDDIQQGEELVCDYDKFFDEELWAEFGL